MIKEALARRRVIMSAERIARSAEPGRDERLVLVASHLSCLRLPGIDIGEEAACLAAERMSKVLALVAETHGADPEDMELALYCNEPELAKGWENHSFEPPEPD